MQAPMDLCRPIKLERHNPGWKHEFAAIAAELQKVLAGLPIITIEHVGSTSIPDLIAKPVLDIDIEILPSDFEPVREALVAAGYVYRQDSDGTGRHLLWQPGTDNTYGEPVNPKERKRNTYIVFQGHLGIRNHRDLKRVLTEDADLRKEYGETKKWLIERDGFDLPAYNAGKNRIMEKILKKAGPWTSEELRIVQKRGGYDFGLAPRPGDWICDDSTWFDKEY